MLRLEERSIPIPPREYTDAELQACLCPAERRYFLGYEQVAMENTAGKRPVSSAGVSRRGDFLYMNHVATLPAARRKGYGLNVVRDALNSAHAAFGLTKLALHASDSGLSIYKALGMKVAIRFRAYELPPG